MPGNEIHQNRPAVDLGELDRLLDTGRAWNLAPVLEGGGALIFGDGNLARCGAQAAASVQACLACGKRRVIAIGPLRPAAAEIAEMRRRVDAGESPFLQAGWGIHGEDFPSGPEWEQETSLDTFKLLWEHALGSYPAFAPELVVCYPFLANGSPSIMPGMAHLRELAVGSAVVAAMSPFGARSGQASPAVAARKIAEGLKLLSAGDYAAYRKQAKEVGSDGADVGQVLRCLIGPWQARIIDTVPVDLPDSGWQAGALIALTPASPEPQDAPGGAPVGSGRSEELPE